MRTQNRAITMVYTVILLVLCTIVLATSGVLASSSGDRHILGGRRLDHLPHSWEHVGPSDANYGVRFAVRLRHRNLDKMNKLFEERTNPQHPLYRKWLSKEEADELIAPAPQAFSAVRQWLEEHQIPQHQVHQAADTIHAYADVLTASKLFDTEFHHFKHSVRGSQVIRQVGSFSVPMHLKEHVSLVTGLSELFPLQGRAMAHESGEAKLVSGGSTGEASASKTSPSPNSFAPKASPSPSPIPVKKPAKPITIDYNAVKEDDLLFAAVTPWAVRDYYKIPRSARAVSNANRQAVVGFNDLFDAPSLKAFQQAMGLDQKNISRHVIGKGANNITAHEEESDLDVQYMIGVGQGVETWFFQQGEEAWLLEWADDVLKMSNPPLVYSISYGWPEEDQCYNSETGGTLRECKALGYDSKNYVAEANIRLQTMGLRGLTIVTSSGDDGAAGQSWNVPLRPPGGSACGQFTITKGKHRCNFPLFQTDCVELRRDPECQRAMTEFVEYHKGACSLEVSGLSPTDHGPWGVQASCECAKFKTFTKGKCSVGPYVYDSRYGYAFQPDFPASSPFVTSVGATTFARAPRPICRLAGVLCPKGEVATSSTYTKATITTGGGFAVYSPMPSFQSHFVNRYLELADAAGELPPRTWFEDRNRAYPDVAAIGTKCETVISAQRGLVPMDGTSCSAPIFAGMLSLINDKLMDAGRSTLGFVNPMLYQAAVGHPEAYNDVTMGESSCMGRLHKCAQAGWKSYSGWDPLTGLGSPNYFELERYILSHPDVTATDVAAYDGSGSTGSADETAADEADEIAKAPEDDEMLIQLGVGVQADGVDPYLTKGVVWAFAFGFFVFILIPAGLLILAYFKLSAAIGENKSMYGDADDEEFHSLVSKASKASKEGRTIVIDDDDEAGENKPKKRPNERRAERLGPAADKKNIHPKGDKPVKNPYE